MPYIHRTCMVLASPRSGPLVTSIYKGILFPSSTGQSHHTAPSQPMSTLKMCKGMVSGIHLVAIFVERV